MPVEPLGFNGLVSFGPEQQDMSLKNQVTLLNYGVDPHSKDYIR